MTQEEKDILIKDLCARLSYGVKCISGVDDAILIIEGINPNCNGASEVQVTYERSGINFDTKISSIKPYLFPLSNMTEEQLHELREMFGFEIEFGDGFIELSTFHHGRLGYSEMDAMFDYFNRNHFDYRGLIPMGLANDATGLDIY